MAKFAAIEGLARAQAFKRPMRDFTTPADAQANAPRLPMNPAPVNQGSQLYARPCHSDKQPASFVPATKLLPNWPVNSAHAIHQTCSKPQKWMMEQGNKNTAAAAQENADSAKALNQHQRLTAGPGKQAEPYNEIRQNHESPRLLPAHQRQQNCPRLANTGRQGISGSFQGQNRPTRESMPAPASQRFPWPAHFHANKAGNAAQQRASQIAADGFCHPPNAAQEPSESWPAEIADVDLPALEDGRGRGRGRKGRRPKKAARKPLKRAYLPEKEACTSSQSSEDFVEAPSRGRGSRGRGRPLKKRAPVKQHAEDMFGGVRH